MSSSTRQPTTHHIPTSVAEVHGSSEFAALRRRSRSFTFIVGGAVFGWFLLLFWAVGYQPGLMAHTVVGHFTVGLLFAWSQVLTTLLVAALFVRQSRANRPVIAELRRRIDEGSQQR